MKDPIADKIDRLTYVVPAHNEEEILADTVSVVRSRLSEEAALVKAGAGASIWIIENGSNDRTFEIARSLEGSRGGVRVHAVSCPQAGIGYAYHLGLERALREDTAGSHDTGHWILLTAADLPFTFTDLDGFVAAFARDPRQRVYVGSKAHPQSRIETSPLRTVMTSGYRILRRAALGMRTGDSRGTIFLRADLARAVLPKMRSRDYFYSTELIYWMEREGDRPVELPVELVPSKRLSKVHPVRDSWRMLKKIVELRGRGRSLDS